MDKFFVDFICKNVEASANLCKLMAKKESIYQPTEIHQEFECMLDDKSRILIPAALKKQLPACANENFVIVRGTDNCLNMYPEHEWAIIKQKLSMLNLQNSKNRAAVRLFTSGLFTTSLDAGGRLLLPKNLCEEKGIKKELVLNGMGKMFELWDKKEYRKKVSETNPEESDAIINETLGSIDFQI
ncbi:MAG: division/cell wall cluster transcriptional repressor MraZ [Bacteroidota bacterium]